MLRTTQDRLELSEIRRLLFALLLLVVELVLALSEAVGAERGQYGGDLDFLRCHHTPTAAAASNHYIELWTPGAALQRRLVKRLGDHAGLTFAVE